MPSRLGDPAADAYLGRLLATARHILGDRLTGAWIINSGARGDYVAGSSDLDVTVGVDERLPPPMRQEVADALRHRRLPCPSPRLELVVYRRSVLAAPGPRPDWELNLNTGPAIEDHVGTDPSAEPAHWFVLDLAMAREASGSLLGPPLHEVIGELGDRLIVDALRASAAWHGRNDTEAPNRVLNACRAWRWLVERRWSSKTEAAAWAIDAGGDRRLIELALARRRRETDERLPPDRVEQLAVRVSILLERAAARLDAG